MLLETEKIDELPLNQQIELHEKAAAALENAQNYPSPQWHLDVLEIQTNITILHKHWSKQAIDLKTKDLVEFHLGD